MPSRSSASAVQDPARLRRSGAGLELASTMRARIRMIGSAGLQPAPCCEHTFRRVQHVTMTGFARGKPRLSRCSSALPLCVIMKAFERQGATHACAGYTQERRTAGICEEVVSPGGVVDGVTNRARLPSRTKNATKTSPLCPQAASWEQDPNEGMLVVYGHFVGIPAIEGGEDVRCGTPQGSKSAARRSGHPRFGHRSLYRAGVARRERACSGHRTDRALRRLAPAPGSIP